MNKQTNLQKSVEFKNAKDVFNYMKTKNLINQSFEIIQVSEDGKMKIGYSFKDYLLLTPLNDLTPGEISLEDSINDFDWKLEYKKDGKFLLRPTIYYEREDYRSKR
jgi:hypothetical protein